MRDDSLQRALRDPSAWVDDVAAARARYVLCCHVLELIARATSGLQTSVLAVKGAGLANTVYPKPWARVMDDIDLLVHPRDRRMLTARLVRSGCVPMPRPSGRKYSAELLDEVGLVFRAGETRWLIELHSGLDKVVARPVPYDRVRARSVELPAFPGLRTPSLEDHALLVALHASASVVAHPVGLLDLDLLLRAGADQELLVRRAARWRLRTALFLCLARLRALGSESVAASTLSALGPSRARSLLLPPLERVGAPRQGARVHRGLPAAPPGRAAGLKWLLRQTPLRDDLVGWVVGVARYGALRLADAVVERFSDGEPSRPAI